MMRTQKDREIKLKELRQEGSVWTKFLVEQSAAMGRLDPGGMLRTAFGEGVDSHWTGRMVDVVTFGTPGLLESWRISMSMTVESAIESYMRDDDSDVGKASLGRVLGQVAPHNEGPDIFVLLCSPELTVPAQFSAGSRDAMFLVGSIGNDPSPALRRLASNSGGHAMTVSGAEDAKILGALYCQRYYELARSLPSDWDLN